jgi:protease IV
MTYDADLLADRRRLRRKLSLWRVVAFAGIIAAIVAAGVSATGSDTLRGRPHVAKVALSGFIAGDQKTLDLLKRVGESKASAVLVMIDSPGGTTAGAEAIYGALRRLSVEKKKPTVAVVGTLAASGGYISAIATDRIVTGQTSLVGSIGVLVQYPNFAGLLERVGVNVESVKSSPLKAAPSGYEPTAPEARAALTALVGDTYNWFKQLVRERRNFADSQLAAVTDGRVFTGRQALELKLIDQIGDERDAIAWLEREKGIAKGLPVREWKTTSTTSFNLWSALGAAASVAGYDDLAHSLRRIGLETEVTRLDGLLAVWHPSLEK